MPATAQMAQDMLAGGREGVTRAEMMLLGWSAAQLDTLGPGAVIAAQIRASMSA